MISCGEPSGDMYAAELARQIRAQDPSAVITGFGGDRLRAAGAELLGDFSGLSVTGLLEVVRLLPRTLQMYRRLVAAARRSDPTCSSRSIFPISISGWRTRCGGSACRSSTTSARSFGRGVRAG